MYDGPNQPQQPPPGQPQQPPYGQPPPGPSTQYNPQQYGPPQPPYGPPPYGAPPVPGYPPGYAVPQQQQKGSLRWLWITLGIVGGIVVLSCAGCAIAGAFGFNILSQTVAPAVTAQSYYQAIQNQDYTKAYSYLDSGSIAAGNQQAATQDAYAKVAQVEDTTLGKVTKASVSSINVDSANTNARITMTVTRNGQPYDVHLQVKKVNGDWKITSFDKI